MNSKKPHWNVFWCGFLLRTLVWRLRMNGMRELFSSLLGFPSFPIWHDDDMILDSREEEKGLFGSRIVSEGHSSPDYTEGDQEVLHQQFLKTLYFLKNHERKANNLYFGKLALSKRIDYLIKIMDFSTMVSL